MLLLYAYARRIPSIRDLERKTLIISIDSFQNIANLSKLPQNPTFLTWLKPFDDSSETKPTKFRKHVSSFRKNKSTLIQLHVSGVFTDDDPGDVAEVYAKHFYTTFSCTSKLFISIPAFLLILYR
jgi:hypothetical protein